MLIRKFLCLQCIWTRPLLFLQLLNTLVLEVYEQVSSVSMQVLFCLTS